MQIVSAIPIVKINLIKNTSPLHTHVNRGKNVLLPGECDVTQLHSRDNVDFTASSSFIFSEKSF